MSSAFSPYIDPDSPKYSCIVEFDVNREGFLWGRLPYSYYEKCANEWPVKIAEAHGHKVEYDGVTVRRWTCVNTGCGMAVLEAYTGNIYGRASELPCSSRESLQYKEGNAA